MLSLDDTCAQSNESALASATTTTTTTTVIGTRVSICAICKDDISTNLGRRRLLFHLPERDRDRDRDATTEVVKQMHDMMSLFANGSQATQCDLTDCTLTYVEAMSAKWCCRKCERMVNVFYKKFIDLQQFYNQYKHCPLSSLLNALSINNINNDCVQNDSENTITIHGVIIDDSELRIECTNDDANQEMMETNENLTQKHKHSDDNTMNASNEETILEKNIANTNQIITRSKKCSTNRSTRIEKFSQLKKKIKSANKSDIKKNDDLNNAEKQCKSETMEENVKEVKLNEMDSQILSSLYSQFYEGILRAMLSDEKLKTVAITEVGKFVSRELLAAATDVAKMSHSIETLKIPEFKKLISCELPSSIQLLCAIIGKDSIINPPIITLISILIYLLNSHANLFQKMIATLLLQSKCNASTIEKLHTYKMCIAYETLVSFIDKNIELAQIPKLIKSFQLT